MVKLCYRRLDESTFGTIPPPVIMCKSVIKKNLIKVNDQYLNLHNMVSKNSLMATRAL